MNSRCHGAVLISDSFAYLGTHPPNLNMGMSSTSLTTSLIHMDSLAVRRLSASKAASRILDFPADY